jgi:hypothetical protein
MRGCIVNKSRQFLNPCINYEAEDIVGELIMTVSALARKLKLKSGQRAVIVNAPPGYIEELSPLPEDIDFTNQLEGQFDWVQVFVKDKAELEWLASHVTNALKPESLLWIAFPKGSSGMQTDLTRDQGWEPLEGADLKWINLVSVNEAWSAFSLRPYKPGEKRQSFR